ncbi:hypothetical protein Tco_0960719 [Tanacetum coccineum]
MSPISSFPMVEESVDEYKIGDEYLTDEYVTEKEQQQLLLDEEALRETLKEEARAEKETFTKDPYVENGEDSMAMVVVSSYRDGHKFGFSDDILEDVGELVIVML